MVSYKPLVTYLPHGVYKGDSERGLFVDNLNATHKVCTLGIHNGVKTLNNENTLQTNACCWLDVIRFRQNANKSAQYTVLSVHQYWIHRTLSSRFLRLPVTERTM